MCFVLSYYSPSTNQMTDPFSATQACVRPSFLNTSALTCVAVLHVKTGSNNKTYSYCMSGCGSTLMGPLDGVVALAHLRS